MTKQEAVDALVHAARATLTEQRREFVRGEIGDLDKLEDALEAYRLAAEPTSEQNIMDQIAERAMRDGQAFVKMQILEPDEVFKDIPTCPKHDMPLVGIETGIMICPVCSPQGTTP